MITAWKSQSFQSSPLVSLCLSNLIFPETSLLISRYFSHPEEFPYRLVPRFPCTSEILTRLTGLGSFVAIISDFWQTNMR